MGSDEHERRNDPASPLLVFVHGFSGDQSDWDAQVAFLSPLFDTLALDLPGHGGTPPPDAPSVESLADALCAETARHEGQRLVLVGHSLGCRVILEAYRRLRRRVLAMVLIDDHSLAGNDRARSADHFVTLLETVGYEAMIGPAFARMFGPASDPALRARIVARAKAIVPAFAAALIPSGMRWEARVPAILAAIHVPILIIQSTNLDEELNWEFLEPGAIPDWGRRVLRQVPGARFEVIAGAGHFVQIEAADSVNRLIEGFVEPLRNAPADARKGDGSRGTPSGAQGAAG